MGRPVFVLLHGAWHSPQCWGRVIQGLEKAGYTAVAPTLPSTGSDPPTPDWSQDIEVIRRTVSELAVEHDVVVVTHSFSGMTGGTALEGLDKDACRAKGLRGGVVRMIYVYAFLVPEGFQHSPKGTRDNLVPEIQSDLDKGIVFIDPKDAKDMFYQDIDDVTVTALTKDLRTHSLGAYWSTTTYAAWRVIPTTYVVTTKDKPEFVVALRNFIKAAKASGTHRIDSVIEIDTGHSPFLSKPEWTTEMLIQEGTRRGESS